MPNIGVTSIKYFANTLRNYVFNSNQLKFIKEKQWNQFITTAVTYYVSNVSNYRMKLGFSTL
jgi:hypothetical protein